MIVSLINLILFLGFLRMSLERLDHLLVTPLISKEETNSRKSIPSNERLALTLTFLASRVSQISLSFQFRLGRATFSRILSECCEAIYQVLSEKYLRSSKSPEERKTIPQQFEDTWNMPHVIDAIDGKHVRIKSPKNTEAYTTITNDFFVLLAICDDNYWFTLFDVGQYDSNNDSGVIFHSNMGVYFATTRVS